MYLLIDWGNSRLKYLLVDSLSPGAVKAERDKVCVVESLSSLNCALSEINTTNEITHALIASVKNEEANQQLEEVLDANNIRFFFAQYNKEVFAANKTLSEKSIYADPNKMGVDRWLGLLAADKGKEPVGLIDLGSAITVDLLDEKGAHLGGHILPGLRLLKNGLSKNDRISIDGGDISQAQNAFFDQMLSFRQDGEPSLLLGNSTSQCIDAGIAHLLMGYLKDLVETSYQDHKIEKWLVIGGDAAIAQQLLSSLRIRAFKPVFKHPKLLIFQGLILYFLMCESNH